ncbi:hypothetical protein JET15_14980, partial [Clostridium tyrobutyricum]|nr:hypothetical protein [Clostridium tyrobutyricum]
MNNKGGLSPDEIIKLIDSSDFSCSKKKIELKIKVLNKYIEWTNGDYKQYEELLYNLKQIRKNMNKKTKKDKRNSSKLGLGKSLENIVNFIFEKSYFYKVYPNKRTATNEIDQFIVLSDKGKQAIEEYKFSKKLFGITDEYLLCECKNYKGKVGGTWVGKFYTLMNVSGNCSLGIIFSYDGLTG